MTVGIRKKDDESVAAWLLGLFRRRLVQNVLTLSSVQVVTYVLPLLTIPYLVRTVGPAGFGIIAFYQSFALFGGQFVEFGFHWSGTRAVAQYREEPKELGRVYAEVIGAKLLLCLSLLIVGVVLSIFLAPLRHSMLMLLLSLFWAFGQGSNVIWFYHGLERMRFAATLSISSKLIASVGVFVVVRSPSDAWKVLALHATGACLTAVIGFIAVQRWIPVIRPSIAGIFRSLKTSATFFFFNSTVSLYTAANPFILGLFAAPRVVGYFAAASRMSTALLLLLTPFTRALYPRISYLASKARDRAAELVRLEMRVVVIGAAVMAAAGVAFAPLIVRVVLGPGFEPAIPVLRIGVLLPLVIAPSIVLGVHWMMSVGLERTYLKIVVAAGVLNFCLATLLAPRFGATGMMTAVLLNQVFVTTTVFAWLRWRKLDPFRSLQAAVVEQAA